MYMLLNTFIEIDGFLSLAYLILDFIPPFLPFGVSLHLLVQMLVLRRLLVTWIYEILVLYESFSTT